ncbi:type III PLP-dependent enzyme [Salipiger bermudensis]|uniref:ornithine decarboxylase n=1 Tax=Salipiger bermudensis (strain DSM 26914 / JCM 13377 / KCTC 12554 / HTCC2601) TaxID=314265 RepID=Q0FND7_SALBH|nr:type III PLP-dependent enzyme [Salipiger bermudensis]EAU45643.1 Putative Ornithine decarboxylase [Salipiger bermudensis HTCC2601]
MGIEQALIPSPETWLARERPDEPVFFFCPQRLGDVAGRFLDGFPGVVSYAVKANPLPEMIEGLWRAGLRVFDVASPAEMALVRAQCPEAVLHYHNPVRSQAEVSAGLAHRCVSWSVDRMSELEKLAALPAGTEIAVRLKLPVAGAAYDFGAKFGAEPAGAVTLLRRVAEMGLTPSLTFHPGTQCRGAEPWARYIHAAAGVARDAGVTLHRLNVGGGFPSDRGEGEPDLETIFATIGRATREAFPRPPDLVCEPGRGLCAEAFLLALKVKAVEAEALFVNDGIYGSMAEWRDLGMAGRVRVVDPAGRRRGGRAQPRIVFGPTCDSLDRLPEPMALPAAIEEGDFVICEGMGAYSRALVTGFNGYGARRVVRMSAAC